MTKLTYNPNFTPLSGLTCGDFFHGKLTNIDEPTVYLKNLGNDKHELISLYGDDKKTYFVGHGRFPCFKAIDVEFEIVNIDSPTFELNGEVYYVTDKMYDNLFNFQIDIYKQINFGYKKCYLYSITYHENLFFIRSKFI